jgi:hypothetical protein
MLDRWQQQCQLINTACRLRGGAGVIGVQRAPDKRGELLATASARQREHGRRDTYELERLPFSHPAGYPATSDPRAPASLAVVRCDAGKTCAERRW